MKLFFFYYNFLRSLFLLKIYGHRGIRHFKLVMNSRRTKTHHSYRFGSGFLCE